MVLDPQICKGHKRKKKISKLELSYSDTNTRARPELSLTDWKNIPDMLIQLQYPATKVSGMTTTDVAQVSMVAW